MRAPMETVDYQAIHRTALPRRGAKEFQVRRHSCAMCGIWMRVAENPLRTPEGRVPMPSIPMPVLKGRGSISIPTPLLNGRMHTHENPMYVPDSLMLISTPMPSDLTHTHEDPIYVPDSPMLIPDSLVLTHGYRTSRQRESAMRFPPLRLTTARRGLTMIRPMHRERPLADRATKINERD